MGEFHYELASSVFARSFYYALSMHKRRSGLTDNFFSHQSNLEVENKCKCKFKKHVLNLSTSEGKKLLLSGRLVSRLVSRLAGQKDLK